jgi:tRNA pseudouridine38-40 synthase
MARIAVGVEYEGSLWHGWQSQSAARSVQQAVEAALSSVADQPVATVCAGRTDAGVHAVGQVVHFDCDSVRSATAWMMGTNNYLPADIGLRWVREVPGHFHARYSAESRTYRYWILNRRARSALAATRALLVHRPLDADAMQLAGTQLLGEHDFSAFRAAQCQARSPIRRLTSLRVQRTADWIVIEVTANAFLQHMVRNMVGLLLAVGRGDALPERAREQLESRHRPSGEATAAAHGLYFWRVQYPAAFGLGTDSAMIVDLGSPWMFG